LSGTLKYKIDFNNATSLHLAPILKTSQTIGGITTVYETTEKNYTVVYNALPTVAYRSNQIGINFQDFSNFSNASAVISAYNERQYVYLKGSDNTIEINLGTGEVTGLKLTSMVIDCGTW
jgi:hypothetical protein